MNFAPKPNVTEYFVQWWDRQNGGWLDMEGYENEEKAHEGALRLINQDIVLGVENPRYRVVVERIAEYVQVDEVEPH